MQPAEAIYVNGQPFFGRVQEQQTFRSILPQLQNPPLGAKMPFIILLHGNGGIGKTTLARRFKDITQQEAPFAGAFNLLFIDWETQRKQHTALAAGPDHISPQLIYRILHRHLQAYATGRFNRSFKTYEEARDKIDKVRRKAIRLAEETSQRDSATQELTTTVLATLITAPIGGIGESLLKLLLDQQATKANAPLQQLGNIIKGRWQATLSVADYRLLEDPQATLGQHLATGIAHISSRKPLVIILDTYEIVDVVDHALRPVIRGSGPQVAWIISGRHDLSRSGARGQDYFTGYRADFGQNLIPYDMGELAQEDVRRYFAAVVPQRPLTNQTLQAISQATRGIPLAVREAATIWQKETTTLDDIVGGLNQDTPRGHIVRAMTERYFLHCLHHERDQHALYALALAQGHPLIYGAMLQTLLTPDDTLAHFLRYLQQTYASVHLEEARLHNEPALFLRQHLHQDTVLQQAPWLQQMQTATIQALRQARERIEQDIPLLEERCLDEDWLQLTNHLVRHLLWLDKGHAWDEVIPRYVEGWAYNRTLQKSLLQHLQSWPRPLSSRGKRWRHQLQTALEQPQDIDNIALLLNQMGRWTAAGKLAGPHQGERHAILRWQEGRLAHKQGELQTAVDHYQQAIPHIPTPDSQLQHHLAQAMYDLAYDQLWPNNRRDAVAAPMAVPLLKQVVTWQRDHQRAWFAYGIALEWEKQYEAALAANQQAISLNPQHAQAYYCLGSVYNKLGQYEAAIHAYQQSLQLDPQDAFPWNGLGNVYHDLGQYEAAIHAYQERIRLDPQKATVPWTGLGIVYLNRNDLVEAKTALQKAAQLDSQYANPHRYLSVVYWQQSQIAEAITQAQTAVHLEPDYLSAHLVLAALYRQQNQTETATHHLNKAQQLAAHGTLSPVKAWRLREQAALAALSGEIETACHHLQASLAIAPGDQGLILRDPPFQFLYDTACWQAMMADTT